MSVSRILPLQVVSKTFEALPGSSNGLATVEMFRLRLLPKEHGAYAILGIPLVVSLMIAGITQATVLFSIATVVAFLAHEPMLIVTGCRGNRARRQAPQAGRILITRLIVAASSGLLAWSFSPPITGMGMLLCLLFAVLEVALTVTGNARSLAAQLAGLAGLTLPAAVLLTVGGIDVEVATQFWLVWFAGRVATTASVRTAIARHRHRAAATRTARICDGLLVTTLVVCIGGIIAGPPTWLITIPLLVAAIVLRILTPSPAYLKQMGWSLLAVNVLSGVLNVWIW